MTGAYLETSYRICHDNFGLPKISVWDRNFQSSGPIFAENIGPSIEKSGLRQC